MDWTWAWGPPAEGSASFGDNPFFDVVRVVLCVAGLAMCWGILRIFVEQRRRPVDMGYGQAARFFALLVAAVSLSITELWVMGTPATPRLLVNLLVVGFGSYGVWALRKHQRDQPIVR